MCDDLQEQVVALSRELEQLKKPYNSVKFQKDLEHIGGKVDSQYLVPPSLRPLEDDETLRTKKGILLKKRTDILKILKQANIKTVQDFMLVKDWNDKRFEHMLRWMKQICQDTQKETNDRETAKATLEWQRIQRANG